MDRAADFFVSYTSADRAWVEWIAWQLEAEGYQVVVQAWDFTPGRDWAHEMQHATTKAERVVAVLSAAYLESGHGEAEWRAFYAKDPSGEHGLLLPVRVSDVEPPGLLTTRIYVDLVGRDAGSARAALLAAARGRAASRPRRRSSLVTGGLRSAPPRRPGSQASCPRSGTCRSTPIPSSPAATYCWLSYRPGFRHPRRPFGGSY
jgi:TIR domain